MAAVLAFCLFLGEGDSEIDFDFRYYYYIHIIIIYILLLLLLLLLLLQLSFDSVAVVLTLVQTKQIIIHINETIQKHSTNNTKHSKYKYTYYQNTHKSVKTPTKVSKHPRITKQVTTTTVQDTQQMK